MWGAVASFTGAPEGDHAHIKSLLAVHLNLVLYSLCFWLCQPVLPFLSKQLGMCSEFSSVFVPLHCHMGA